MRQFVFATAILALLVLCARGQSYDPQEHILCVIETKLSKESCKETARNGVYAGGDPKQACASLMAFESSLGMFGCTPEDFAVLKSIVCDHKKEPCNWV